MNLEAAPARRTTWRPAVFACLMLLAACAQAQFTYVTNNGTITITGFAGFSNSASIPSTINGRLVTAIGSDAFNKHTMLKDVTIPYSVTNIGSPAFSGCTGLGKVTFGNSITSIGSGAFEECASLTSALFQGNAPSVNGGAGSADRSVFAGESGTVYYLPGTTGWASTFGGWPTAL
jgi:hypothetical protein